MFFSRNYFILGARQPSSVQNSQSLRDILLQPQRPLNFNAHAQQPLQAPNVGIRILENVTIRSAGQPTATTSSMANEQRRAYLFCFIRGDDI